MDNRAAEKNPTLLILIILSDMKVIESMCDERVFDRTYREHAQVLRNFMYSRCGDLEQAEDLAQEAFIKLWDNCAKVMVDTARAFLFKVAKNAFYNQVEHQKVKLKYLSSKSDLIDKEDPHFKLREKEFQDRLDDVLARMAAKNREVFLMNRIEKLKYKEIAELLDISIKTVEKRMHTALLFVRKEIKGHKF